MPAPVRVLSHVGRLLRGLARVVRTFVVGFTEADAGTVTFLHNVASAGGTGRAFLPKALGELQDALLQVVGLPVCGEK